MPVSPEGEIDACTNLLTHTTRNACTHLCMGSKARISFSLTGSLEDLGSLLAKHEPSIMNSRYCANSALPGSTGRWHFGCKVASFFARDTPKNSFWTIRLIPSPASARCRCSLGFWSRCGAVCCGLCWFGWRKLARPGPAGAWPSAWGRVPGSA